MARKDRPQHRHTRPQAAATGPSGQRVQGSMGMTLNEDDEDDDDVDSDDDDDDDDDDDVSCTLCKLNGVACKALNLFNRYRCAAPKASTLRTSPTVSGAFTCSVFCFY